MLEKTIQGIVLRSKFQDSESGFAVLYVELNTPQDSASSMFSMKSAQQIEVVGTFNEVANGAKLNGLEYEFTGEWSSFRGTRQFSATSAKLITNDAVYFLSRFVRGIGPKLAQRITDVIPPHELATVIEKNPEELLSIKGVGKGTLQKIQTSWVEFRHLRKLSDFFAEKGVQISVHLLLVIERHFGENAKEIIENSPYRLAEIHRVGFKTADKVAMSLGLPKDSPERLTAAALYILQTEADSRGSTLLSYKKILSEVSELLEQTQNNDVLQDAILDLVADQKLYVTKNYELGLMSARRAEEAVGRFFMSPRRKTPIAPKLVEAFIVSEEMSSNVVFSEEQKDFIRSLAGDNLTVSLAGYAGVGKTTVFKAGFQLLSKYYCHEDEIIGCAFTGMAASRLHQVSGVTSMTIHSLLKYDGTSFQYNRQNPLPYRVIALDESAMVNLWLMSNLIDAVRKDTLFVCIGDPAQLEPIGAGNVFSDVIHNQLSHSHELTRIYRNDPDSVLTYFASFIRKGQLPEDVYTRGWKDFDFDEVEPHNIFLLKRKGAHVDEIKDARQHNNTAILGRLLHYASLATTKYEDPIWDFQVLTFMREGVVGVRNLNLELQKILNPAQLNTPEVVINKQTLRLGDKLVHLQNRDMSVMSAEKWEKKQRFMSASQYDDISPRVYNGSLGRVVHIAKRDELFYVMHLDGRVVEYDFSDYTKLIDLAYALTVHKAQGSQYKEVAIPLTTSQWMLLNTKSLYTAMTRAIQKAQFVGQKYALKRAATNIEETVRLTNLSQVTSLEDLSTASRCVPELREYFDQLASSEKPKTLLSL